MTTVAHTAAPDLAPLDGLRLSAVCAAVADSQHLFVWFKPLEEDVLDELHHQWRALTYSYRTGLSEAAVALATRCNVTLPEPPVGPGAFGDDPTLSFGQWRQHDKDYQVLRSTYITSVYAALSEARTQLLTRSGAFEFGNEYLDGARSFSDDTDVDGYGPGQIRLAVHNGEVWSCGANGDVYADLEATLLGADAAAALAAHEAERHNREGVLAMSHLELFGITSASEFRGDKVPDEVLALSADEFAAAAEARRADLLATPHQNVHRRLVSRGAIFAHDPKGSASYAHSQYLSRRDVALVPAHLVAELQETLHTANSQTNPAFSGEFGPEVNAALLAHGVPLRQ
jgi:hypothetical protein